MTDYIAHRFYAADRYVDHALVDHLRKVGDLAAVLMPAAAPLARLAGRWHDLGKYSQAFQDYIRAATADANDAHLETDVSHGQKAKGRVDHSTAGAQHAMATLPEPFNRILAYVIAGHHTGLPDWNSPGASCLQARLKKAVEPWRAFAPDALCQTAELAPPPGLVQREPDMSFFIRMLFSALVDADFLDTEHFFEPERRAQRTEQTDLNHMRDRLFQANAERAQGLKDLPQDHINHLRHAILQNCLTAARWEPGFFSLTVPTGGGKTLSSLSFALEHAVHHQKSRIIYAIPFTSIIEQNAAVFRDALGQDAVLEHHSNLDPQKETARNRLTVQNWAEPLVVTTNVQLFESLYAAKTSRVRKLHNLANSIIILDEVQVLPMELLRPCLEALRTLVTCYGASVVLCSATQPALRLDKDQFKYGLDNVREIMMDPSPSQLHSRLKRVRFETRLDTPVTWSDLAAELRQEHQVLCIVNTKPNARQLFEAMDDPHTVHLSTNLCPAHRRQALQKIRDCLATDQPVRVISTQLIEAGVDVDFPVVFRALAGLDSVIQAAGRCNREGRQAYGRVVVFQPQDGGQLAIFKTRAQLTKNLLAQSEQPDLAMIRTYYQRLFAAQTNPGDPANFDTNKVMHELTKNFAEAKFPFRSIAKKFRFIDDDQQGVIIPFDEKAKALIKQMAADGPHKKWLRALQPYVVNVRQRAFQQIQTELTIYHDQYPVLRRPEQLYHPQLGLCLDQSQHYAPENLTI